MNWMDSLFRLIFTSFLKFSMNESLKNYKIYNLILLLIIMLPIIFVSLRFTAPTPQVSSQPSNSRRFFSFCLQSTWPRSLVNRNPWRCMHRQLKIIWNWPRLMWGYWSYLPAFQSPYQIGIHTPQVNRVKIIT